MKIINTKEFNEIKNEGNLVIDFYADWCGPCKMLSPVLEKISADYPNVNFVKVNCDNDEELAMEFGVMSIPAVFMLKDGKVVNKFVGSQPESKITQLLDESF
ncbi:MAG: thioredoxin [Erysipelotrichaceae bacterium]|nr:thioredoxin [Erysipelotrichaceae bacterium]